MKKILIAGIASLALCSVAMAQKSNSATAGAAANGDHSQASGGIPGNKPGSGSATVPYSPVPNPGYVTSNPSVMGSPGMSPDANAAQAKKVPGGDNNAAQGKGTGPDATAK